MVVAQYTIPRPGEAQPPLEDTVDHREPAVDSTSEYPFPHRGLFHAPVSTLGARRSELPGLCRLAG